MKRILFSVALFVAVVSNLHAMRCGTHLVNEGGSITQAIQLCGTPSSNTYSDVIYINKDGDGMNYYLHVDGAGMIDSISYSRGGR